MMNHLINWRVYRVMLFALLVASPVYAQQSEQAASQKSNSATASKHETVMTQLGCQPGGSSAKASRQENKCVGAPIEWDYSVFSGPPVMVGRWRDEQDDVWPRGPNPHRLKAADCQSSRLKISSKKILDILSKHKVNGKKGVRIEFYLCDFELGALKTLSASARIGDLYFSGCTFPSSGIELDDAKELKRLVIGSWGEFGPKIALGAADIEMILRLPSLASLSLNHCSILLSNQPLKGKSNSIEEVLLADYSWSGDYQNYPGRNTHTLNSTDIRFLHQLPKLRNLTIDRCQMTPEALNEMSGLSLSKLEFDNSDQSDEDFRGMKLRSLSEFSIDSKKFLGSALQSLPPDITILRLVLSGLRGDNLAFLGRFKNLKLLYAPPASRAQFTKILGAIAVPTEFGDDLSESSLTIHRLFGAPFKVKFYCIVQNGRYID